MAELLTKRMFITSRRLLSSATQRPHASFTRPLRTQFENDGYLTGIELFSPSEMGYFIDKMNELEKKMDPDGGRFVSQEINTHLAYEFLWDLTVHPKILSLLQEIFSEGLALLSTTIFAKYPQKESNKYVGFHQDVAYWGLTPNKA
eukprot:209411_1